eukprot:8839890-Pyramimonas_sp.AAC.1
MCPGELEASRFPAHGGCALASAPTITFRGGPGQSIIDYFLLNSAARRMYASVGIDVKWAKRGHRPAHLLLKGDAEHVKRLVYTVAPKMSTL